MGILWAHTGAIGCIVIYRSAQLRPQTALVPSASNSDFTCSQANLADMHVLMPCTRPGRDPSGLAQARPNEGKAFA